MRALWIIAAALASAAHNVPALQAQTATIEDWDRAARMCEALFRDEDTTALEALEPTEIPEDDPRSDMQAALFPQAPLIISWLYSRYNGEVLRASEGRAYGLCLVKADGIAPDEAVAVMGEWMLLQQRLTATDTYVGISDTHPSVIGPARVACGTPGDMTVTMSMAEYGDPFFKIGVVAMLPKQIAIPCPPPQ